MSKLDHTLAATWSITSTGDHTVTGCTVGQPVLFLHGSSKDTSGKGEYVAIKITSGAGNASSGNHYVIGTYHDTGNYLTTRSTTNVLVVIPSATSVTVNIINDASNSKIYVYKT